MKIPVNSPQARAARGIVTAVRNSEPEGVGFDDAIMVHTRGLDREQLLEVLGLLAGALFLVRDALEVEAANVNGD